MSTLGEAARSEWPVRTYEERRAANRLPLRPWVGFAVGVPMAAGALWGARESVIRATFLSSAMGYLTTSLLDFGLHFRMEKEATGKAFGFRVIPKGETANHVVTIAVLVSMLAGRFRNAGPALFLALGWRDEIVYHRKRSDHREDMLHAVAHLAVGVMLTSLVGLRCKT